MAGRFFSFFFLFVKYLHIFAYTTCVFYLFYAHGLFKWFIIHSSGKAYTMVHKEHKKTSILYTVKQRHRPRRAITLHKMAWCPWSPLWMKNCMSIVNTMVSSIWMGVHYWWNVAKGKLQRISQISQVPYTHSYC